MKTAGKLLKLPLVIALIAICSTNLFAQAPKDSIKSLIADQHYVFEARTAMSMGGHTRQLTSIYTLTVNKDSIVAYLPYFGRAYTAPIDPSKGGIEFNSKDFEYHLERPKKGGWRITIKPEDTRDVQQMILTISQSGYGLLQVTSNNRQSISFSGVIRSED